jgi:hypothetical protein
MSGYGQGWGYNIGIGGMAAVVFLHHDQYGGPIPVAYADNGDGSFSPVYAEPQGEGGLPTRTFYHNDRTGSPIPVQYLDNGDGTFSPTAASTGGMVNAPVTPTPGGPSDASVQLSYGTTFVLPGANNGDGLQLPPAKAGTRVELYRQANPAYWVAIFVSNGSGDTVNGINDQIDWFLPADTGASPPLVFLCGVAGAWNTNGVLD